MNSNNKDFESARERLIQLKDNLHSIAPSLKATRTTPKRVNDTFSINIANKLEASRKQAAGKEN